MSDKWIILIPENAGFVPQEDKQKLALTLLRELAPEADETEIEITDKIRFEHCGGNFESVACPDCGTEVEMEWWSERMNEDFGPDKDFKLKPINMPCCGTNRTLHELRYDFAQGFARFSLSALNPNIGYMNKADMAKLEEALGCALRVVYRRM